MTTGMRFATPFIVSMRFEREGVKMANDIYLEAMREGYNPGQVPRTMTVGELIGFLEDFDPDSKIYLRHDSGYTYGGIVDHRFEEDEGDYEDDE